MAGKAARDLARKMVEVASMDLHLAAIASDLILLTVVQQARPMSSQPVPLLRFVERYGCSEQCRKRWITRLTDVAYMSTE